MVSNQDGFRTDYVIVHLLANGTEINSTVLNASNNWTYTFLNLDKYFNGTVINYTVTESEVLYYNTTITTDGNGNWTVVNNHVPELVNVTVEKVWNDTDNQDGYRTDYVVVRLLANGTEINSTVLNASNNWTYTFLDLDKYFNGTVINYTVSEDPVEHYNTTISSDGNGNWTIFNDHITELINITVEKVWTDNDNQDGIRPDNITVHLIKNETVIRTAVLNDANNWTYTFLDLDKFENNGTLIVYSINETEVINYTAEITGDNVSFVINNTHVIELINVTVVKVWNDGNNTRGVRPANVTVVLLADGNAIRDAVLSDSNNWTYTFEGLDKFKHNGTLIMYSIKEVNVGVPGYTTNITNSTPYYWIVNNTYPPKSNKTANESKVYYHDFIEFNITITNIGIGVYNQTLIVNDTLPYGLDYNKTISITGARVIQEGVYDKEARNVTWIITEIYPDTPAIITILVGAYDVGNLTNNVTLIGPNGYEDKVWAPIEVLPIVDVAVNKTVDNELHYINDIVVWTIRVSNAYNGTNATDVVMNDILPVEFEFINYTATVGSYDAVSGVWTIGFMGNGTEETLVITSRAKAVGTFINFANVTCNETEWNIDNNFDNATVTVKDLDLKKGPDKNVTYYHDDVLFNLTVINDGEYDFTRNITVVDNLPDGIVYIETIDIIGADVVQDAVLSNNGRTVTWVITNISANSTAVIIIRTNTTSVGPKVNPETIIFDNGYNKTVNTTIKVLPIVDVAVNKTVDNELHYLEDIVVWTIRVSNAYNGTNATDVVMNDILPAEFEFINYTATVGNYDAVSGVWTIGFMGNGTEETLVITSRAKAVGTFINFANVTCNETDWNKDNNFDNATVTVKDLDLKKIPDKNVTYYHDDVLFNLTVINDDEYVVTRNVIVVDNLPDGIVYIETVDIIGADVVQEAVLSNNGRTVTWVITNISGNSTAVITIRTNTTSVGDKVNPETIDYGYNKTVNTTIKVLPIVDVAVTKTVDNELHFIDDVVVWTIKVSNAYNGTNATDVVMNDILPAEFEFINYTSTKGNYNSASGVWTIGFMGNGTEETLVITSRAKAVGTFINFANVTCNETDWDKDNNFDNATVTVVDNPDIEKAVNNTKPYHYEFVEYYLTIKNTDEIDYTNKLDVIDSLPDGLIYVDTLRIEGATLVNTVVDGQIINWTLTDIKAKSSAVITVKVFVEGLGNLTNNGTLVPAYGNNVTVNCTITPIPIADLEVIKLSDGKKPNTNVYSKGNTVTWTIKVINNGPDDAINAFAADFLPAGLIYVSDDSQGAFDHNTGIWNIGNLAKGESVILNIVTNISITNARITNNVNVTSETYDPNETNNHDNNTIVVAPEADLEITKLVSQVTSRDNDIITWTIIVKNNGPDTAVNAVVSDKLPSGVVYISDDSNGAYNHKTGVWKLGNLAKGQSKVLHIKTRVKGTNRTITNFANVTSDTPDPDESNNKDNNTTKVGPVADLMIIKDVNKDTVKVGEKVEFTIVVRNLGPDTAVNTRAYDVLPDGLKLISFKVSRGTYDPVTGIWNIGDMAKGESATLSIVAKALVVGEIVNEAYVESDTYDNNTSNNYDNATVTVVNVTEPPEPPVSILKLYPTGNPLVMVLLALLTIVGVSIRRRN